MKTLNSSGTALSAAFHTAAASSNRKPRVRLDVLWNDPNVLSGNTVETTDYNRVGDLGEEYYAKCSWHDPQLVDTITTTPKKYLITDGSCTSDGTYHTVPNAAETAFENQVGWYSASICDGSGIFSTPPEATVVFGSVRTVQQVVVIGEPTLGQYPTDFEIFIYDELDVQLNIDTEFTGTSPETYIDFTAENINTAKKMTIIINGWSHPNTVSKIVEFFGTISDTFYSDDITSLSILEEREASNGTLPIGNSSINEMDVELNNIEITRLSGEVVKDPFFPDNTNSYLSQSVVPNIRMTAHLGFELDDVFEETPEEILVTEEITFSEDKTEINHYDIFYNEKILDAEAAITDENGITVGITSEIYVSTFCQLSFEKLTGTSGTFTVTITGKRYIETPVEYVPMGTFWTTDWDVQENNTTASASARDRLEILRGIDFVQKEIYLNKTLYEIAELILNSAKVDLPMFDLEWDIDAELQNYTIPVAWFGKTNYFDALSKVAGSCLGNLYMRYDDVLIIDSYKFTDVGLFNYSIERDDYTTRNQPVRNGETKNRVIVVISPLEIDSELVDVKTTDDITFGVGVTSVTEEVDLGYEAITDEYEISFPETDGITVYASSSVYTPTKITVTIVKTSGTSGTCKLKIKGKRVVNIQPHDVIADDSDSILQFKNIKEYKYSGNFLIQEDLIGTVIANSLLQSYSNPRRDAKFELFGDPAHQIGDVVKAPIYTDNSTGVSIYDTFIVFRNYFKYDGSLRCSSDMRKVEIPT